MKREVIAATANVNSIYEGITVNEEQRCQALFTKHKDVLEVKQSIRCSKDLMETASKMMDERVHRLTEQLLKLTRSVNLEHCHFCLFFGNILL